MVLTLLAAEGGARVYRRVWPQAPNNRYSFRLARPAPYRDAWYFSPEFVDETFRQPNGWHIPPNTRLLVPGDFQGRYVNIEQGRRRTTDSPAVARHTLFVIGGSAVYAAEVPDRETIPSHLQRLLNARRPGEWRVLNYGTISVTTGQQVELLRTLAVAPGELVVFYDGVNDVYQGIYNGDPRGWVAGENRKQLKGAGFFKTALIKINAKYAASKLQSYSAFAGTVFGNLVNRQNLIRKAHLNDPDKVAVLARETAGVFRANLAEADRLTRERGARFVHFLQPQIFGERRRTPYEDAVVSNFYINPNGLETVFMAGYPLLREAVPGVASFDLSGVLEERRPGQEFYLDFCHVNHVANARIAVAMMGRLFLD